jgi:sugar (pentulose or hexulose) kinase
MKSLSKFIAVDLGAESGRIMLGTLARGRLALAECRRFDNRPLEHDGTLRWDFPRLIGEIKTGIAQAARAAGGAISGLAVDSWGVDFGLLGSDGRLLELPYHYRDGRTEGMPEKAFELMPRREMYMATGIQLMQINSVFQLLAMKLGRPAGLSGAHKMLMIADLVAYELCGRGSSSPARRSGRSSPGSRPSSAVRLSRSSPPARTIRLRPWRPCRRRPIGARGPTCPAAPGA